MNKSDNRVVRHRIGDQSGEGIMIFGHFLLILGVKLLLHPTMSGEIMFLLCINTKTQQRGNEKIVEM